MARGASDARRRSADDWIEAGYALVAEAGVESLKLDRLCAHLGVTKGSFYWHFADMAAYRAALIRAWAELRDRDRSGFAELPSAPPREQLSHMMASLRGERQRSLERAMREWARTDREVAESVHTSDQRVLSAVRRAYQDAGFDAAEADMRANATFAAGIGFLHLSNLPAEPRMADQLEQFLDVMLRR
ncbi:MAG: TetR/AcrR family transcriptional regulator [Mycobacterium kyogaense]|uniref:TetR/AcrR family transcriptional regulator n=1 Tax=Mycobacterium kyogaense TaxID=2212479 RepID=UPI002FFAA5A3